MNYIKTIIKHVQEHLGIEFEINYMSAKYAQMTFLEQTKNFRYKERKIIPCMLIAPNFKNLYSKQNQFAFDGTIGLSVLLDYSEAHETIEKVNEFIKNFNGYFVDEDGVKFKYKTTFALEGAEMSANGALYNTLFISLGVHFTNLLMGDQVKIYMNDMLIDDFDRSLNTAVELYVNAKESQDLFGSNIVGTNYQLTFSVSPLSEFGLLLFGKHHLNNVNLRLEFPEPLTDITFKGKIVDINITINKNQSMLIAAKFVADE